MTETRPGVLDLRPSKPGTMPGDPFSGEKTWKRESVTSKDWTIPLDETAIAEVRELVASLRRDPLPTLILEPDLIPMPACRAAMARVRALLDDGLGVCVVERLPMEEMNEEEATSVYWVLGRMVGRLVAQKWDGTMLYDVTDTGRTFGHGVRGSWTNTELFFHTDNAFGTVMPDYVSLLCINPALEGGISRFCSLYTVHNRLREESPRLLQRLYEPLYFDRQAEHSPDAPPVSLTPMFSWDGMRLNVRMSVGLVKRGYPMAGQAIDPLAAEALEALEIILRDESLWIEFRIERGQLQFLNNTEFGHYRSTFSDDPALPRHLIRLWYRSDGRRSYEG